MPRLIDATKWEEFYKKMTDGLKPYDHYDDGYRDAMDNVDDWMDVNQVEAEPVRHGRWRCKRKGGWTSVYECSVCGRRVSVGCDKSKADDRAIKLYPYCHCGAKMDGGQNNER